MTALQSLAYTSLTAWCEQKKISIHQWEDADQYYISLIFPPVTGPPGFTIGSVGRFHATFTVKDQYPHAEQISESDDSVTFCIGTLFDILASEPAAKLPIVTLPLVRRLMPSLVASSIVGVQPMIGPTAQIHSLQIKHVP